MTINSFSPERYFPSIYDLPFSYRSPDRLNACPGFAFFMQIFHGGPMWASAPTEHNDAWRKLSGASGKSQKRCQWQKKRGDFEEVPRLAGTDSACQSAGTTVGNRRPLRSSIGKRCVGAGFYSARGRPQGSPLRMAGRRGVVTPYIIMNKTLYSPVKLRKAVHFFLPIRG